MGARATWSRNDGGAHLKLHSYRGACFPFRQGCKAPLGESLTASSGPQSVPFTGKIARFLELTRRSTSRSASPRTDHTVRSKAECLESKLRQMESQNVSEPSSSARQETQSAEATDVQHETASLQKIVELLKAKDDTSKFVGLALLKSALDNSPKLRQDENTVLQLWNSISPKFLNRLIRTGSGANAAQKDAKDMLELAIAVIHTFTALLPDEGKREEKLIKRIPLLVGSIPHM